MWLLENLPQRKGYDDAAGQDLDAHLDRRPQLHQKQRRGCQKRFVTEAQCETALAGTFAPAGWMLWPWSLLTGMEAQVRLLQQSDGTAFAVARGGPFILFPNAPPFIRFFVSRSPSCLPTVDP